MILTKDNLKQWKEQLDKDVKRLSDFDWDLSKTLSDEEWLADYLEEDTEDVVRDEISYGYL